MGYGHKLEAAEVRRQSIGNADAADPWRAGSESRSEASWLSASILHDLRNPVGTIYAGAEMLMTLDTAPNQVKRLCCANMHRAAGRLRELLNRPHQRDLWKKINTLRSAISAK